MATLTLKRKNKQGTHGIYSGGAVNIQFPLQMFPNKEPLETMEIPGILGPREKKTPMTAEQRKAARKNRPQLTLAERIKRQEDRLTKLKEQAAKDAKKAAEPEAEPAAEPVGAEL